MKTFGCYFLFLPLLIAAVGCAGIKKQGDGTSGPGGGAGAGDGSGGAGANAPGGSGGPGGDGSGGGGPVADNNPTTCAQAATSHSYVGCEFWPTITANPVWTEFDPAVIIANGGSAVASVTVDGPGGFHKDVTVAAGQLETVLLAWVMGLKGPEFSLTNTSGGRLANSMRVNGGAYHVKSSVPVTAWQFNPLQYTKQQCPENPGSDGCLSASVDASILLPATAMTGNYRIFGYASKNEGTDWGSVPGGMAITATADNTTVKVQLGPKCGVEIYPTTMLGACIAASMAGDIPALNPMQVYTVQMNAGDVVELVGAWA